MRLPLFGDARVGELAVTAGVPAIVRLVLFGGLSTLLVGLVAFGALLIADRRAKGGQPTEEEPDRVEPPPTRAPSRVRSTERRLPSLAVAACTPKPGRACWRGKLRLTDAVRKAWAQARDAARRAAADDADEADETDETDDGDSDDGDDRDDGADEVAVGGDVDKAAHKVALPPEGSFAAFFDVRAVPRDDQPGDSNEGDPATLEADDDAIARVSTDGTFDIDVSPGRYDLEVVSKDQHLIGGLDGLDAVAGDARGEMHLVLAQPVAIAGRVVDDDGVAVDAMVDVQRVHQMASRISRDHDCGRFVAAGLRTGAYKVTVSTDDGDGQSIEVRAPLDDVTLRVPRLPAAMLLVGAANDGHCPKGRVTLVSQDERREHRFGSFIGCQTVLRSIRPGSTWLASGKIDGKGFSRVISFGFGKPLMPVCLDGVCRADIAAVDVRVADSAGNRDEMPDVEVLAGPNDGPPVGTIIPLYTWGLRSGATLTLRARKGAVEGTTTVWLTPGVNDVVIRLPGRIAGVE